MEKKAIDFSDLQHRLNFDPENHDYEQSSLSDSDTLGN